MTLSEIESRKSNPVYMGKWYGKQLTWAFEVEKGAGVPEHHHPHEQIMHVVEGEFEFT